MIDVPPEQNSSNTESPPPPQPAPPEGSAATQSPASPAAAKAAAFITDYLPLACFLTARGYSASLRATGSKTILFLFDSCVSLIQDIADFHDGKGVVEPTTYDAARIQLRKRMDALKGGGR